MGWVAPTLAIFFGIIITSLVIIVRIQMIRRISKIDVIENADFIEIGSRKKFTNGYSKGLVKSQVPCKNGCIRFEFYPIDYEQGENKKIPQMQVVICKEEFVKRLARGDESGYRNVVRLIDRFKTDLPEKLRNTSYGDEMSIEGQKRFLLSAFGNWVRAGDDALLEALANTSRVGITKLSLASLKEQNDALRKMHRVDNPSGDKKESV